MNYKIVIEPRAVSEIQEAVDYYDSKRVGFGSFFLETVNEHIEVLITNPMFQLRYKDYRGLPVRNFPFLILFCVDEKDKIVFIMSIFNTYLNPTKYPK
jgi:toxin ParE1/3/4